MAFTCLVQFTSARFADIGTKIDKLKHPILVLAYRKQYILGDIQIGLLLFPEPLDLSTVHREELHAKLICLF